MKNKVKKQAIVFCCSLLALGVTVGAMSLRTDVTTKAEEVVSKPTVEMLVGARIKFNEQVPSLKFEGVVSGYEAESETKYGMLIMSEATYLSNTFDNNYHTVLNEDLYEDNECTPYAVDEEMQIASYIDVAETDYATSYIAIGYSVENGAYNYAEVSVIENARSVVYVAQMSLLYDNLTEEAQAQLESYVDASYTAAADYDAEEENYNENQIAVKGTAKVSVSNYAANLDYSETREGFHTFQTTEKYQNITEIQFDAYVPMSSANRWWGIAFTTNTEQDCYADATVVANLQNYVVRDTWVTYKYTTTDGVNWKVEYGKKGEAMQTAYTAASTTNTFNVPAHIFMTSAPTAPGGEGTTLQLDNFHWVAGGVTYTEDFNTGDSVLFTERADSGCDPVTFLEVSKSGISIGASTSDYAAELSFTNCKAGYKSFTTKEKYSSITEVKVDVYIPSTNENNWWWGIVPVARNSGDAYEGSDAAAGNQNLNQILVNNYGWKDQWVTLTYTVSNYSWALTITRTGMNDNQQIATFDFSGVMYQSGGASYIYVCANPDQGAKWGILMDNFSITAGGVTYTDDFNTGASTLFEEHVENLVSYKGLINPSFDAELTNGTLTETLNNMASGITVKLNEKEEWNELSANALRLEAALTYSITGEKGVVIAFGSDEANGYSFLYLNEEKIAFYVGNTCQSEISLDAAANSLYISVLENGSLLLKVNDGEYVGMGVCSNVETMFIADVEGAGEIMFTKIAVNAYNVK
ncbi:MAG: hypothetical protein IKA20_00745 [Clostridia bacterium]|nr:hypothetical protein [Clostridia bacterium]